MEDLMRLQLRCHSDIAGLGSRVDALTFVRFRVLRMYANARP
jgi:hypothetical protein